MKTRASLAAACLLAACQTTPIDTAAQCAAPRLVPSELRIGDGALDRGWIGGVSLVDVDNDGDLDLYATHGYDTSPGVTTLRLDRSMLYLNDGAGNFTRDEANALSNADKPASGGTWGDVDHDGDLDVFVSTQLGATDVFYRNQSGGQFAREELGEATTTRGGNFTSSWADIDHDGDLDLVSGGPALEPVGPNLVYRNDNGAFVRVTDALIENGASNPGAVLWADVDNDGDQDFFVANSDISRMSEYPPAEFESSQLYINDGAWRFTRSSGQAFSDPQYPILGAAFGDIDNDGDLDLFAQANPGGDLPNGARRDLADQLFRNVGDGQFERVAEFTTPTHHDLGGGATFADVDLDGDLDLVFAGFNTPIALYLNDGHGAFTPSTDPTLAANVSTHASVISGDIDDDGDMDVIIGNWGDQPGGDFVRILRNESAPCGQAVRIRLRDRYGAADPIGARVTLITRGAVGVRRQTRESMGQTTFRGQSGDQLFFGMPRSERVVSLEIRWPNGATQSLTRLRLDRLNEFREPEI